MFSAIITTCKYTFRGVAQLERLRQDYESAMRTLAQESLAYVEDSQLKSSKQQYRGVAQLARVRGLGP